MGSFATSKTDFMVLTGPGRIFSHIIHQIPRTGITGNVVSQEVGAVTEPEEDTTRI